MATETKDLNLLKQNYQDALDRWITTIQCLKEMLADTGHSARAEDDWKQAHFAQKEAQEAVKKAREEYEEGVQQANFGF